MIMHYKKKDIVVKPLMLKELYTIITAFFSKFKQQVDICVIRDKALFSVSLKSSYRYV